MWELATGAPLASASVSETCMRSAILERSGGGREGGKVGGVVAEGGCGCGCAGCGCDGDGGGGMGTKRRGMREVLRPECWVSESRSSE